MRGIAKMTAKRRDARHVAHADIARIDFFWHRDLRDEENGLRRWWQSQERESAREEAKDGYKKTLHFSS